MPDTSSEVAIIFRGSAQSIDQALKQVAGGFGLLGHEADAAAAQTRKVGADASHTEAEVKGLTRGVEVAADAMALFSKESAETTRRLFEIRSLASDMRGAFSTMGTAIAGGMAAFAGVAAVGFLKASVDEALQGEQAQARLNAALKNNKDQIEQVNKAAEAGASTWAQYGVTVGQLKGIMAGAVGRGIDPQMILGNARAFADLKIALGTDIPGAIEAVTSGPRGAKALSRALNLNTLDARTFTEQMAVAYTGAQRLAVALQYVEKSRFAGQGDALANTDTGKMLKFQTSMKDLQETLGTYVIPLLGNFADALNNIIQAANGALGAFGGLTGVLQSKWLPVLVLGLAGWKALHGIMGFVTKLFRTDMLSGLQQTTQATNDATVATGEYVKELGQIPPDTVTVATFNAAGATAVKEPYIANIRSIPTTWTTTATFVPAAIPAEPTTQPISVPVTYDTTNAFTEAQATPIHVPVTYDSSALTEQQAAPIKVPVIYDGALTEQHGTPVKVPVIYAGHLSEDHSTPVKVPVIYNGALTEQRGAPVKVPVIYAGHLTEQHGTPVKVPVTYSTSAFPLQPLERSISQAETYARTHPIHVPVSVSGGVHVVDPKGGYVDITPRLDPKAAAEEQAIRQEIQAGVNKGGPIPVRVRPQWTQDAMQGLKAGLAGGVAFGVTDALFNGLVTINHANMPNVHLPPSGGGGTGGHGAAGGSYTKDGAQRVYITNMGFAGGAYATGRGVQPPPGGHVPGGALGAGSPLSVRIDGQPTMKIAPGQGLNITNWPGHGIGATPPSNPTVPLPVPLPVKQSGGWTVGLNPDTLARMGSNILQFAIGGMLANVFSGLIGKIPFGKILEGIKNLFKGGGGGPTPPSSQTLIPQWSQSTMAQLIGNLTRDAGVPAERALVPFAGAAAQGAGSIPVISGLAGMASSIAGKITGAVVAAFGAATVVVRIGGALAGAIGAGLAVIGKLLSGAGAGGATILNPVRGKVAIMVAQLGIDVVQALIDGIKKASGAFAAAGQAIIGGLMAAIRGALPGFLQGAFDNLTGHRYTPHPGRHATPAGAGLTGTVRGGLAISPAANQAMMAQLAQTMHLQVPRGAAHAHAAARAGGAVTLNVHPGAIVVNGVSDPQAAAAAARRELEAFVRAL